MKPDSALTSCNTFKAMHTSSPSEFSEPIKYDQYEREFCKKQGTNGLWLWFTGFGLSVAGTAPMLLTGITTRTCNKIKVGGKLPCLYVDFIREHKERNYFLDAFLATFAPVVSVTDSHLHLYQALHKKITILFRKDSLT